MSTNPARRPGGTPTGGQFAPEAHAEPEVALGSPGPESIPETDGYGGTFWRTAGGQLHRTDGPAIELASGTREWWVNGWLHRTDGPAFEWASGTRAWWVNGKRHRTDGPAVEWADGTREWWVDGRRLTEEEFHSRSPESAQDG